MSDLTNRIRKRLTTTDIPITNEQIFELLDEAEEAQDSLKVCTVARNMLVEQIDIERGRFLELTKQLSDVLGLPRYTLDKHLGVEKCVVGEYILSEDVNAALSKKYEMPYGYKTVDQLLDKIEELQFTLKFMGKVYEHE